MDNQLTAASGAESPMQPLTSPSQLPRKRPGAVTAIAVIKIILGSLAAIPCLILLLAVHAIGSTIDTTTPLTVNQTTNDFMILTWLMGSVLWIGLFLGIAYIIIGIGLLRLKQWARIAAIILSILNLMALYPIAFLLVLFRSDVTAAFSKSHSNSRIVS